MNEITTDIHFTCPSCGGHIAVEPAGVGIEIACPHCSATTRVPANIPAQPAANVYPTSPRPKAWATLPVAYALMVSNVIIIFPLSLVMGSLLEGHVAEGANFGIGMIFYFITTCACFAVWAKAKGHPPVFGAVFGLVGFLVVAFVLSLIGFIGLYYLMVCGPAGGLVAMLLCPKKEIKI